MSDEDNASDRDRKVDRTISEVPNRDIGCACGRRVKKKGSERIVEV